MTTITSASLPAPVKTRASVDGSFAETEGFWRHFFVRAFRPYRPELHYMRGPGPAWRAKHMMPAPSRARSS
jgi:hypothetical protein